MHELLCVTFAYVKMWMCVHFLCFYISSQGEEENEASHPPGQKWWHQVATKSTGHGKWR